MKIIAEQLKWNFGDKGSGILKWDVNGYQIHYKDRNEDWK